MQLHLETNAYSTRIFLRRIVLHKEFLSSTPIYIYIYIYICLYHEHRLQRGVLNPVLLFSLENGGVVIKSVTRGSPAAQCGLLPGMYIYIYIYIYTYIYVFILHEKNANLKSFYRRQLCTDVVVYNHEDEMDS